MAKRHNGRKRLVGPISAEEFAALTVSELYDMVEQSGERLFTMMLNGEDGAPFALFSVAIDTPEKLNQYGEALRGLKPTVLDVAVNGALGD
jgi:hypothetical protein